MSSRVRADGLAFDTWYEQQILSRTNDTESEANQLPIQWVSGLFPGDKTSRTYTSPYSVEGENEWNCTSNPHVYLDVVDGEKFAFLYTQVNIP
jgi:hypothetical protein